MPDTPLRVLIVGAGIAGPALGFWLHRLGHACTILERWDTLRVGGQQIDIRRHGIDVIKHIGVFDDIRKHLVDEGGLKIVNDMGKPVVFFPRNEPGSELQGFTSEYEIMRGDLCKILYEKTKDTATHRFSLSVDEFHDTGDAVQVKLSDGSEEEYDMLVGGLQTAKDRASDGPFARTRATMPGSCDTWAASHATTPWCEHHKTRPDEGQVYLRTISHVPDIQEALEKDVSTQKKVFADSFEDLAWDQVPRLLDAMDTTPDFYAHEFIQVYPKTSIFQGPAKC